MGFLADSNDTSDLMMAGDFSRLTDRRCARREPFVNIRGAANVAPPGIAIALPARKLFPLSFLA